MSSIATTPSSSSTLNSVAEIRNSNLKQQNPFSNMKVVSSLCLLAVLLTLNEASPIHFGHGPVIIPDPGYGPVPLPGYGQTLPGGPGYRHGPRLYRPLPSQSYNRQDVGASSKSWNSGGNNAYDNQDIMTGGGANHQLTSDRSQDGFYQGDDRRSRRRHDNEQGIDGNGEYSRNFDDDNASWDRDDNRNSNAQSDADISRRFGRDRSVTSRGSQSNDNRNDKQRSTNTADDQYSNGPGGVHQKSYRNQGASRRRNHDRGDNAFDNGDQYRNNGQDRDTWSRGSSGRLHRGDGKSSFNTDSSDYNNDRFGVRSRNFHDEAANADAADTVKNNAHDRYDGGRDWNRDTKRSDLTSQSGSSLTNDVRHRLTDDAKSQEDAGGVHSSRDFAHDDSLDNIADDSFKNTQNADESLNYGENQKQIARQSDGRKTAIDSSASSRGLSTAAGEDQFGRYSTGSQKNDASSRQTIDTARADKDRENINTGFGFNQAIYDKGSEDHSSQGTVTASNNDKSDGANLKY